MAVNISVQYNGGLLPDSIMLTQGDYYRGGNLVKYHIEAWLLQPMKQYNIITTRFDDVVHLFLFCFCPVYLHGD